MEKIFQPDKWITLVSPKSLKKIKSCLFEKKYKIMLFTKKIFSYGIPIW